MAFATGTPNYGLPQWGENEHVEISPDINGAFADIDTNLGLVAPVGSILIWPVSVAPNKYLLCQGQTVSRTTYAGLFAVLGATYGAGDGSTTFVLPNLKGKIPVGLDGTQTEFDAIAEIGGEKNHVLIVNEMPNHAHQQNLSEAATTVAPSPGTGIIGYNNTSNTVSTGGGLPHNNMPPFIVMNYIIRALA